MTGPTLTISLDQAADLFECAADSRDRGRGEQASLLVVARFLDEHRFGARMSCPPPRCAVEYADLTWTATDGGRAAAFLAETEVEG